MMFFWSSCDSFYQNFVVFWEKMKFLAQRWLVSHPLLFIVLCRMCYI
ncbi:hypothetical protein DFA_09451 [Cavenderia fasciculata]|uniref:Uncharacterized protein n=1 Tax=Cavenderia fasciculata TaxID=261658 RepID=F4Q7N4_CACFS|nr:uncharacterized protein DFA_09451 [Cavenderia fasciculata]EGG16416.1 hypothetical protein DFA_09451 [Cavenderia fasciculata]|eukprot:XP_004354800.1 hypothetical protein DFA_09451 [Cavenderia fasciculata]